MIAAGNTESLLNLPRYDEFHRPASLATFREPGWSAFNNSRTGYGQDGVQVICDRFIYPNGSSPDLAGMAGQDVPEESQIDDIP